MKKMNNKKIYKKIAMVCMAIFVGFISTASAGEISGIKWNDSNGNMTMDDGELGVQGVTICLYQINICTVTNTNGYYSFTGLLAGPYYVYEIVPDGTVQTYPFGVLSSNSSFIAGAFNYVTLNTDTDIRSGINFGNRMLIPPPQDVSVVNQSGLSQDGIPTILRPGLTTLTIRKNLSSTSNVVAVKLTLTWLNGYYIIVDMAEMGTTGIWEANINEPSFPPGTAQMKFEVDVAPSGPSSLDAIQKGDIMFIDPSGKILNQCTDLPIEGAVVSLFLRDPLTGNFDLSPGSNQDPSTNPLITGADGKYSWMAKSGWYKVRAEKNKFVTSWSDVFEIPPPVFDLDFYLTPIGGCDPTGRFAFLQPINSDGSSIFKLKSTIPVKFQKWDENGNFINDAVARINLSKITDNVLGSEIEANSTSEATTGNLFRYESTDNQYIFNLGTKGMSAGTWQIRILFNDGTDKVVRVSLK